MKLLEISESIHGELPLMGMPCTIIRFAGCNLNCYYCDTTYDNSFEMELSEVMQKIEHFAHPNIMITGGEPLINPDCQRLVQHLSQNLYSIVLETNGTIPLPRYLALCDVTVVMDIKLFKNEFSVEAANIKLLGSNDAVKFVYENFEHIFAAHRFIEIYANELRNCMIIFSPIDKQNIFFDQFMKLVKDYPDLDLRMQCQIHKVLNIP